MISHVYAIAVNGLQSTIIDIEVDIHPGLPVFTIVGLPDQGVQESRERIRSAMKSAETKLPTARITINLAPANIKKSGPSFDLGIAVGILYHAGYITESEILEKSIFLGELGLGGELRPVSSILPAVIAAKEAGFENIFVPQGNKKEASVIEGIAVYPASSLSNLISHLNGDVLLEPQTCLSLGVLRKKRQGELYDFADVVGQQQARRALEIAAAGGHNILMQGPPGSGKTFLAKCYASILPELTLEESIEISKIYSVSGLLSQDIPLITERPFRSVHHTSSNVSLVGGGRNAAPGEISLAHRGVLFLDEILEFHKSVLEVLRQPLEDGEITVTRVNASYNYPAKFALVGAMNPCPCGYLTDPDKDCSCSYHQVQNYRGRLSGPILDRIDVFIEVPKVPTEDFELQKKQKAESSKGIKERVEQAREIQSRRFAGSAIHSNSEMKTSQIEQFCQLPDDARAILTQAVGTLGLSARAYYRVLKLARTIADLDSKEHISKVHILEALSYRKKEE